MKAHNLRTAALIATVLFSCAASQAATIRIELDFDAPTITLQEDGSVFVATPDCVSLGEPGLPLLPACPATVLLPPGEGVTAIRVLPEGAHVITGTYLVAPAQQPQPISLPGPFPPTEPDAAVYTSDTLYPPEAARLVTEQKGWGHGLAYVRVLPVSYRPLSGELFWYDRVVVEVDTALAAGADAQFLPHLRRTGRVLDRLAGMVMNPQDLSLYEDSQPAALSWSRLDPGYYPYVIITGPRFMDAFVPVAEFQSSRGLRARIVGVDKIMSDYSTGGDFPSRVRQFIIDAYEKWGTEYVLLGGGEEVVMPRQLVANINDQNFFIAADCYFEGLDGDWNADGDGAYGEPGEEDLIGEIAVGRVTARSIPRIRNWRSKNEMYTEQPVVSQVRKALFIGEQVDSITWTGDHMDQIKDGADICGYSTVGYPLDYNPETLYERDGAWDKYDLVALMNEGFPTTHHAGHAYWLNLMKIEPSDLVNLTNDGVSASFMFNYSQGCSAGAFDLIPEESICEAFVNDEHGSAAFICNSRSGWYNPGSACGLSQNFERELVDARYGEGIVTAGRMNVDSKTDLIWMLDDYMRYIHYGLNLFGDPALPQWDTVLGTLAMEHDDKYIIGQGPYLVNVTSGGVAVPGATVTMYSSDFSVWTSAMTDDSGMAKLHPGDISSMTLNLKAVKADYLMATDDLKSRRK